MTAPTMSMARTVAAPWLPVKMARGDHRPRRVRRRPRHLPPTRADISTSPASSLPRPKREAAYAVYAFCRLLDDAADTGGDVSTFDRALDAAYAGEAADVGDEQARLALAAFAETVRRYDVPQRYFQDLAAGCRMDLTVNRYATWDALRVYCYHVAGVVGLNHVPRLRSGRPGGRAAGRRHGRGDAV